MGAEGVSRPEEPVRRSFKLPFRGRADAGRAVDEELGFHLELCVEELVAMGWSPEEAKTEARRRFGDLDQTRRYCTDLSRQRERGARRAMRMEELRQDLQYAWRALRKNRGFAAVVIVTLALGIAANTTIFSLMNPYLFRALPYGDAHELVQVGQVDPVEGWDGVRFSLPMFNDWTARSRSLQSAGFYAYSIRNVTGPEGPERILTSELSANMFEVLDAAPALGRTFLPEEGGPGGEDVLVMSSGLWQRRYAGDPDILGRTVMLDGTAFTVVGVMPPDFNFPFGEVKMWIPERADPAGMDRDYLAWIMVGRLADGSTPERARQELLAIQRELSEVYPDGEGRFAGVSVKPIRAALNFAWDVMRVSFLVLLGAVSFVLLIACVNVASLTLARASTRTREVAVRAALGASRGRIVRQMFTESLLMAALGGALGVGLAFGATRLIGPAVPDGLFRIGEVDVDGTVLLFTVVVTLLTPVVFGLAPALAATRSDLAATLKEGSSGGGESRTALRGRRGLVVLEVVMAMVLISGTGLMVRSFMEVQQVDLGFHSDRLLTVEVTVPESDYPSTDEQAAYFERAVREARALPGVEGVGSVYPLPLNHENIPTRVALPGQEPATADEWPSVLYARVGPGYFESMGIPLVAGRAIEPADAPEGERVVVVSRALADAQWPRESPLGKSVLYGDPGEPREATVVGVVGDIRHDGVSTNLRPHLYRPLSQAPVRRRFLTIHAAGDPGALAPQVREALTRIDPNLPLDIRPMREVVMENTFQWSIGSAFLGVFGLVALLLAALGIYGVISYSVARRQREIGLRMALGASGSQIRGVVVGEGLKLTGFGLAIGLVLAIGVGQVMASLLFGVSPFDPVSLGGTLAVFLLVALLSSLVPALRASRVDPLGVLKAE
jgi:predicted permease